jgi:hypothetical protein
VHENLSVFYIVGSNIRGATIHRTYQCALRGNSFNIHYTVYSNMYVNNTMATHCCVFMATVVPRRSHNVTLYVPCLPCSVFKELIRYFTFNHIKIKLTLLELNHRGNLPSELITSENVVKNT